METQINTDLNGQTPDLISMKDILTKYELGFPKEGDVLVGEIISVSKSGILVDLDSLGTGIIYPSEFYDNLNLHKSLKKGDKISVILLELENEEGYRELSLKQAQMTTAWEDIKEKKIKGEIIQTAVLNINKGGLIVEINNIQGFLPLSQLSSEHYPRVEGGDMTKIVQTLQKFRGQVFNVRILDFSETENKLIVSEKAVMNDKLKEEIAKFKIGDIVEGTVDVVTDFGAFVKIGRPNAEVKSSPDTETPEPSSSFVPKVGLDEPDIASGPQRDGQATSGPEKSQQTSQNRGWDVDGLIHISEIDWKIVENPRDYLQVGNIIKAKVVSIDNGRISLSLKALKEDPWEKVEEQFKVGQTLEGEIAKITAYGLLVKISEEIVGLIPANEMNNKKDWSPKTGEKVQVAIVSIEPKEHKMLLTIQPIQPRSDLPESPRSDLDKPTDHAQGPTLDL